MNSDTWQSITLGDAIDLLTGFPFNSSRYTEESNSIPLLRGDNVIQGKIRWDGVKKWPKSDMQGLDDYLLKPGDIVLAMDRPWIEAGLKFSEIREQDVPALLVQRVARLRARAGYDQKFLSFIIGSADFTDYILGIQTGTSVPHISGPQIKAYKFDCPPLPTQRAIARILGALNDKIDLNRRMNRTLEAMAQAVFKSWFVDFDPVTAKAEGRQPFGMDGETAGLFPDSFHAKDEIQFPGNWKVSTVGEEFNLVMGQSPPGSTYNEEGNGISFYQGRTDFGFRYPSPRVYCTAPTRFANPGDTLVSVRAPVGDINMASENCAIGRGIAAIRHKSGAISFTYYSMKSIRDEFEIFEGEGTLFGAITGAGFRGIQIVAPPPQIIDAFEQKIHPLDQLIETNERENDTLAVLRDALLPRLLSGELTVREV